ncbi:hypothetical protein EON65_47735 [archaeon]|nr:MAG: hypothetical protein EON65_47735 [archaeon]
MKFCITVQCVYFEDEALKVEVGTLCGAFAHLKGFVAAFKQFTGKKEARLFWGIMRNGVD